MNLPLMCGQLWQQWRRDKLASLAALLVAFLLGLALFAPWLASAKPWIRLDAQGLSFPIFHKNLTAAHDLRWELNAPIPYDPQEYNLQAVLQAPSAIHLLGTDDQGRDVASRMVHGCRISVSVGFVAVGLYVLIGIFLGACAGYWGGWFDLILGRVMEVVMCFPVFFLILTVLAFIGPSIYNIMIVIGITSWTGIARLVRAEFLRQREQEYVQAARVLGLSHLRIMFRHILPNSLAPVLVSASFGLAGAILVESSLSFLGFGVQPPTPSWGDLLAQSRDYLDIAWWLTFFPGLAIFVTITAFNLLGESLRDALDPRG